MKYDVIVVGAGPAGSTAAKSLAEKGIDVLLIDKATFPREKPCGGAIPMKVIKRFSYLKNSDLIESFSYGGAIYSSSLKYKVETEKEKPIIERNKMAIGFGMGPGPFFGRAGSSSAEKPYRFILICPNCKALIGAKK